MGLFRPDLTPGERVVLRRPEPSGWPGVILGLLLALLCWVAFYLFVAWISPNGVKPSSYIMTFMLPIYVLGGVFRGQRWTVVVTDRRLMVRLGWIWQKPLIVGLDEVEDISMDHAAYRIRIRAAGREVAVHGDSFDLPELNGAIKRARLGALA